MTNLVLIFVEEKITKSVTFKETLLLVPITRQS